MSKEKRRFTRVAFGVKADMTVEDVLYRAEGIDNLSLGGCRLPIRSSLTPGHRCSLRIFLTGTNNGMNLSIEGEIMRVDPEGVALRFTHIDPDSLFHLKEIIRYNSSDPDSIEREISDNPLPL